MGDNETTETLAATTLSTISATLSPVSTNVQHRVLYATNISQLLLGLVIAAFNATIFGASLSAKPAQPSGPTSEDALARTRSSATGEAANQGHSQFAGAIRLLSGNMCFVHCICGIMLCVVNVMDGWNAVALLKTESSLVIINCFIVLSSLLLLLISALLSYRQRSLIASNSKQGLTAIQRFWGSVKGLVAASWAFVLVMMLIKALIFGLHFLGYKHVCFTCYQVFELFSLIIISVVAVALFARLICVSRVYSNLRNAGKIGDSAGAKRGENCTASNNKVIKMIAAQTVVFGVCFTIFACLYFSWLVAGKITNNADEVLITIYFVQSAICPLVFFCTCAELRSAVKRLMGIGSPTGICCCCLSPEVEDNIAENHPVEPKVRNSETSFTKPYDGEMSEINDGRSNGDYNEKQNAENSNRENASKINDTENNDESLENEIHNINGSDIAYNSYYGNRVRVDTTTIKYGNPAYGNGNSGSKGNIEPPDSETQYNTETVNDEGAITDVNDNDDNANNYNEAETRPATGNHWSDYEPVKQQNDSTDLRTDTTGISQGDGSSTMNDRTTGNGTFISTYQGDGAKQAESTVEAQEQVRPNATVGQNPEVIATQHTTSVEESVTATYYDNAKSTGLKTGPPRIRFELPPIDTTKAISLTSLSG